MQVYLLRHTTPAIEKGICYGQLNIPVNKNLFAGELAAIQSKLDKPFEKVYTSPLIRCVQLAKNLTTTYIEDDDLKELNFGDWENKNWDAIPQEPLNEWMDDFVNIAPPGGESFKNLHERSIRFSKKLLGTNIESAAIITHAGNIRSFISMAIGLPLANAFRIEINYGAMVLLSLNSNESLNRLIAIK